VIINTVAVRQNDQAIDKHDQMLKTRSAGTKRQYESPGINANRRYLDWVASLGDETGGTHRIPIQSHRRVTFDTESETFGDADEAPQPTTSHTDEAVHSEWGVDGDDPPHPSTEHCERITWRPAPSRVLFGCKKGRYRESYDLDLLAFQAGSYASDEEETTYLKSDINGRLIKGVQFEAPENDFIPEPTDDKPIRAHSTEIIDAGDLANVPNLSVQAPQAAIENREESIIVGSVEIDFEFGEEPPLSSLVFINTSSISINCYNILNIL